MDQDIEQLDYDLENNLKSLKEFAENRKLYQLEEIQKKKENEPSFKLNKYLTSKD